MDHNWPIWSVQAVLRVHRELVLSSGNTRRTIWQRCLPGVHPEFPQYNCLPEMEPKDTCQCVTTDDVIASKKSAKSFLDHLASQVHCTVSQRCQIYQLEDVQIKPGDTPDELVDCLGALAIMCNFPTGKKKESKHPSWSIHCSLLTSRPQQLSHNSQDVWNMQDSHSHSRQSQCYGPWIQNCQCCHQMKLMTSVSSPTTGTENIKTQEPTCMLELHKNPCTWQSPLHCQGFHMPIIW